MKSVLISIRPKWCELIASGKKTIEVRRTRPTIAVPFKCYIYETQGRYEDMRDCKTFKFWDIRQKVIGEFVCDLITGLRADNGIQIYYNGIKGTCLSDVEIIKYAGGKKVYYWHISELKIYDKPKELGEFKKINRHCWYADLGLAKRDCPKCKNADCFVSRPPQSWCYVEEAKK